MDRAIQGCIGSVAVGAIGGALVGAAIGGNNGLERGAIIGAAAGIGRCTVLVQLAAEEDRRQLREAQIAALEVDRTTTQTISTKSGKAARVKTKVSTAPLPPPRKVKVTPPARPTLEPIVEPAAPTVVAGAQTNETTAAAVPASGNEISPVQTTAYFEERQDYSSCRFTELLINMDGQEADGGKQKWCKSSDGGWEPVAT